WKMATGTIADLRGGLAAGLVLAGCCGCSCPKGGLAGLGAGAGGCTERTEFSWFGWRKVPADWLVPTPVNILPPFCNDCWYAFIYLCLSGWPGGGIAGPWSIFEMDTPRGI